MSEALNLTFSVPVGVDHNWSIQTQFTDATTGDQVPYTSFIDGDIPTAEVWSGQDQSILFAPTTSWDTIPSTGIIKLSVGASQTAALTPGRYALRVQVNTTDNRMLVVLDDVMRLEASPGATAALKTYCSYNDLLLYAPWLDTQEDTTYDLSGFAAQRHQSREWLENIILQHATTIPASLGDAGFGAYTSQFAYEGPNVYIKGLLATDKLMVTSRVKEIVARRTVGTICQSILDPTKQGYASVADLQIRAADNLVSGYIAEFDTNADGIADIVIPCNYVSSRVATPRVTGRMGGL